MSNNYNNPVQFEFFSGHSQNPENGKNSRNEYKCLTLSFENIIVLCIIFVMSLVLSYSFGVEKGKKTAMPMHTPRPIETVQSADNQKAGGPEVISLAEPEEEVIRIETVPEPEPQLAPEGQTESAAIDEPVDEDFFTIQVASFKLEKNARIEAARLKDIGYDIYVQAKGNYSIVCVGKFMQREKAEEFASKLKNRYNDYLVRRL